MVAVRPASATDAGFLQRMLVIAADWRPGSVLRPVEEVLGDPALAHYVAGWPRAGDFGVIAERDGQPVGGAWCRFFSEEDRGYGFVAAEVPELSIGVVAEARGQGVGRALLGQLIDEARARGVERISLSVEVENQALRLYESVGFAVVAEADGAATMVLEVS